MKKMLVVALVGVLLLFGRRTEPSGRFPKYKMVEAYEIRPGIVMMPQYSMDGRVCEIGLERRHYSPGTIRLDSGLSREEIDQIVEELVPLDERGERSKKFDGTDLFLRAGSGLVRSSEFQNVSIRIYGNYRHEHSEGDVAAVIEWKQRKCR